MAAHVAAVHAAHGVSSMASFEALLRFRPVREGVLLSLIDALTETTEWLVRGGDRLSLIRLLDASEQASEPHTREAAAAACGQLYASGLLSATEADRVARLAVSPRINSFSRRSLLYALASHPADKLPPDVLGEVRALAWRTRPLTEEESNAGLDRVAAVTLASRPEALTDTVFLTECLGFQDGGNIRVPNSPRQLEENHAVGLLFAQEPLRFAAAMADILRQADSSAIGPALWAVRRVEHTIPLIADALLERICRMDGGRLSEPAVLKVAAGITPAGLLGREWQKLKQWMPQAREALAQTLAGLGRLAEPLATQRFNLLAQLAGDGLYPIRRAAFRALAICEEARFGALLTSWAVARTVGCEPLRQRASEGCGWLPILPAEGPLAELAWDPEKAVREACVRSAAERSERQHAASYAAMVLAATDPGDVVQHWRYGVALGKIGDDQSIELLEQRMSCDLPPSVRFWLQRVKKAIKYRWDQVTRKWPEPWFTRRSATVPMRGSIRAANGQEIEVEGYIWRTTPEPPERLASWGGWMMAGNWIDAGVNKLTLPGRQPASILVTSSQIPSGITVFTGTGEYPES